LRSNTVTTLTVICAPAPVAGHAEQERLVRHGELVALGGGDAPGGEVAEALTEPVQELPGIEEALDLRAAQHQHVHGRHATARRRGECDASVRDCDHCDHNPPMPELRQLRYFVAVAEERSFTRAAERLHIAPSPLSAAIRRLERELGTPLFTRTTRSVRLTAAGERLLAAGAPALAAVETAFAEAVQAGRGVLGTLRLGASPAARYDVRPALLAQLRERHPGIEVEVSEATSDALRRELQDGRLDAAILFCADPAPGIVRRTLCQEPVHVLMRSTHRLAGTREIRLAQLERDRFVVPAQSLNRRFNDRLCALCRAQGFTPRTVVAGVIWDDAEWPDGADVVTLTTERWARRRPEHLWTAPLAPPERMPLELAWREHDDSPLLATLLALA
jgi:DNA-binding transcriptional LysR family regulator